MASIAEPQDDFAEAEPQDDFAEIESLSQSGTFWSPRNPEKEHPAKLVLRCIGWETVPSKYDPSKERPVLIGETREGDTWKVPCDNLDLLPLHTGDVKQWNEEKSVYEVVGNWGPVRVDEVIAVEYRGDREFTNRSGQLVTTGSFRFTRKPPSPPTEPTEASTSAGAATDEPRGVDDDIPF